MAQASLMVQLRDSPGKRVLAEVRLTFPETPVSEQEIRERLVQLFSVDLLDDRLERSFSTHVNPTNARAVADLGLGKSSAAISLDVVQSYYRPFRASSPQRADQGEEIRQLRGLLDQVGEALKRAQMPVHTYTDFSGAILQLAARPPALTFVNPQNTQVVVGGDGTQENTTATVNRNSSQPSVASYPALGGYSELRCPNCQATLISHCTQCGFNSMERR